MLKGFGGCVGRTRRVAVAVGSITRALAFLGTYAHDQIPLSSRPALQTNEISWLPVIVLEMRKSIRAMACFFGILEVDEFCVDMLGSEMGWA